MNNSNRTLNLRWADEQHTADFAQKLSLEPGIVNAKVALYGDLGVGKTTLTRHLLQALGVQGRIKSPTYTLVESYESLHQGQALSIWHMDFYRFNDPFEWEDAGLRDIFASPGLKIYEWPERVGALVPQADLEIHMRLTDTHVREVQLRLNAVFGFAEI